LNKRRLVLSYSIPPLLKLFESISKRWLKVQGKARGGEKTESATHSGG
jgi:hypothetical protein